MGLEIAESKHDHLISNLADILGRILTISTEAKNPCWFFFELIGSSLDSSQSFGSDRFSRNMIFQNTNDVFGAITSSNQEYFVMDARNSHRGYFPALMSFLRTLLILPPEIIEENQNLPENEQLVQIGDFLIMDEFLEIPYIAEIFKVIAEVHAIDEFGVILNYEDRNGILESLWRMLEIFVKEIHGSDAIILNVLNITKIDKDSYGWLQYGLKRKSEIDILLLTIEDSGESLSKMLIQNDNCYHFQLNASGLLEEKVDKKMIQMSGSLKFSKIKNQFPFKHPIASDMHDDSISTQNSLAIPHTSESSRKENECGSIKSTFSPQAINIAEEAQVLYEHLHELGYIK